MLRYAILLSLLAGTVGAQQYQRKASMVGGGSANQGKCTIEVEVDGAASVEIRGDQGIIRNLSGQPAAWRRFECTGPVPVNATAFRFAGVDGRGRMDLVQDPRNGGAAVVRIEDSKGGREGYTFDLFWGGQGPAFGNGGQYPGNAGQSAGNGEQYPRNSGSADRMGPGGRYTVAWAIRSCQDAVRQRAAQQFRAHSVDFLDTRIDDNPGRNDSVLGRIDVLHGPGAPEERLQFTCSVNFNSGQVRSVQLQRAAGRYPHNEANGRYGSDRAFATCERAVEERIRRDGYDRVDILTTRVDNNPGRSDWVVGTLRAMRGNRAQNYSYSCSVNLSSGDVRSVDVRRR
jgi:hypothetical protein